MYHEYTDSRGNLHRRHNNGQRLYTERVINLITPDDSHVWELQAKEAFNEIFSRVGCQMYRGWWERTFEVDGKTADNFTWKQICEAAQVRVEQLRAQEALRKLANQLRLLSFRAWVRRVDLRSLTWVQRQTAAEIELDHPLECRCVLPEQSCPVCVYCSCYSRKCSIV